MVQKNESKAAGGKARAAALTPKQRSDIAKKAAKKRWEGVDVPKASHIGSLEIGALSLPCAVLSDGQRLISQGGVASAFGPVTGGYQQRKSAEGDTGGLPPFLVSKALQRFIEQDLRTMVTDPVRYRDPRGGPVRIGIPAELIPRVCDVWLKARDAGELSKPQQAVAERADILMRGLAHTGIIALVDEATGFQEARARNALADILEAFIASELQPWVRTFPTDFYQELFRLRGLDYKSHTVRRPQYFGLLTNDIVYKRLAPGVLAELKNVTPKTASGNRKHKYFQRLTKNTGYPKLREHLGAVIAIMKLSDDYPGFIEKLDRLHPRYNETFGLPLSYEDEEDSGKGI